MEYLDRPLTMIEFSTENDIICHNTILVLLDMSLLK